MLDPRVGAALARRSLCRSLAVGLLSVAAGLAACDRDTPPAELPPAASVESPPALATAPEEAESPFAGIELPPFEPLPVPPPEIARPKPIGSHEMAAPAPAAPASDPTPIHPSLETLLKARAVRAPEKRPLELDARTEPEEVEAVEEAPGAFDRMKSRVHVERRSDAIGPAGPKQGKHSETEAGIRVPIDDRVSVEGGVRVDERDQPDSETRERKSAPRVGVEVRF